MVIDAMLQYNSTVAIDIFKDVEFVEEIKKCIQCGMCAGSCPLKHHMDYPPRKIFALLRAGKKATILKSKSIFLCTSCYSCKVRCPRGIPVMDIMHSLAYYATKLSMESSKNTSTFGKVFWKQIYKRGRIDEKALLREYLFSNGFIQGLKNTLDMADMGLIMLLHGRMKLLPEGKLKSLKEFKVMLEEAENVGESI